ncbi:MAG: hypothetical protein ACOC4H_02660 [bacterium]
MRLHTIKFDLLKEADEIKIYFKESSGRTKHSFTAKTNAGEKEIDFDAGAYANGVYFVKIDIVKKDGKKEEHLKKMVIKK